MLVQELPSSASGGTPLRVADDINPVEWNAWLSRRGGNTLFQRAEWASVFATYRLPVVRLNVLNENRIIGGLSLVWQKSLLFGNQLVSLPWFDASGILTDEHETAPMLIERALEIAETRGVRFVQLRQFEPVAESLGTVASVRTDKFLMRLPLPKDPGELWNRLLPKVRNQIRKAENSGLSVEQGGAELLEDFHAVYARNMRDLGSPPHHIRFFEAVLKAFCSESRIWLVKLKAHPVGAGFAMANGSVLEIPWASSLQRYNSLCVNHAMYWKILEQACRSGFQAFHFGRSSLDSGTYQFKKQWGAEPVPLFWNFLSTVGNIPAHIAAPRETFSVASRAWSRLPLWMARALGPHIISKTP